MSHTIAIDHPCSPERITGLHWWTKDLLSFKSTRPLALNYHSGQYARIAFQIGSQLIWRPFSFVSTPSDEQLEFLGVLVPGGFFSDRLKQTEIGDPLWVEHENYGFMTPDRFEDGKHLWLLATGTGIGPFISILRDEAVWTQFQRIILVHGTRSPDQLTYKDELLDMQSKRPGLAKRALMTLIGCVTTNDRQPRAGFGDEEDALGVRLLPCRMNSAWDEGILEMAAGATVNATDSRVMLCGNPAMIEDMRARLHQRGLVPCRRQKPGQFLTENYW